MDKFIRNLARGAGTILRDGFKKDIQINHKKGHWDVVTQYDLAVDKFITTRIRKKFPNHGILSEESGTSGRGKYLWVMDPLDGTRNFSRGIAYFCTAISLVIGGRLELGAVYDPMQDELFFGRRGRGAALNGKKITVSQTDLVEHAMAAIEWHNAKAVLVKRLQNFVLKHNLWQMCKGASALDIANTAAGRMDFAVQKGAYPWDYSAGALISKEAGANVTDFRGRPYKWNFDEVIAANPALHAKIMKGLK